MPLEHHSNLCPIEPNFHQPTNPNERVHTLLPPTHPHSNPKPGPSSCPYYRTTKVSLTMTFLKVKQALQKNFRGVFRGWGTKMCFKTCDRQVETKLSVQHCSHMGETISLGKIYVTSFSNISYCILYQL